MTWRPFALAGGCYEDDTLPWSAQDTVNWIPVMAEVDGTRTPVMLRGVPGLSPTAANGDAFSAFDSSGTRRSGIVFRGAYNADGVFLLVQGTTCYRYNGDWKDPTVVGTVPGVGRVTFAHNQITGGSQIVIANGTAGYVYNTVDGTFAQITDEAFPGAKSVDYIDSYIVAAEPGGRYWFTSDLADATSYNALNRYEAESAPDKIVGLIVSHNEVIVFGERTMEFYYDSGADTVTFQRRSGTQTEVGAASQHAIAKLDNTVYWLGNDGIVYMLNGYTPVRISKHPIEQQIERVDISKCFALVYEDRGHKIVYFTFPDGLTWGYDVSTQVWHRRKSYGLKRWRANTLTKWGTKWYAGDYTNGSLCTMDWGNVNTENFAPLVAERKAAVVQAEMNRFRLNAVELSVDSQKSTAVIPKMSVSGNLPDGLVGASGTMQYTIKNALGAVTINLIGSLPPGATMDATGLVTYDYTTVGNYAWTVIVTDSTGRTAALEDSAAVNPGVVISDINFDTDLTTDSTGRTWTVVSAPNTRGSGITYPILSSGGAKEGTALQPTELQPQYVQPVSACVYTAIGGNGIPTNTDFCVEAFVCAGLNGDQFDNVNTSFFGMNNLGLWSAGAWCDGNHTPSYGTNYYFRPVGGTFTDHGVNVEMAPMVVHHWALSRHGDNLEMWWDGQLAYSATGVAATSFPAAAQIFLGHHISGQSAIATVFPGWVDDFRCTLGWARYTAPFTPPSVPYAPNT